MSVPPDAPAPSLSARAWAWLVANRVRVCVVVGFALVALVCPRVPPQYAAPCRAVAAAFRAGSLDALNPAP